MPSLHPTPCGCAPIEPSPGLLTVRNEDASGVARRLLRGERDGWPASSGPVAWAAAELADGGDARLPDLVGADLK